MWRRNLAVFSKAAIQRVKGPKDMVRIGIIGLRGMGKIRLENFAQMEGVEVAKICTRNPQLLQENVSHPSSTVSRAKIAKTLEK